MAVGLDPARQEGNNTGIFTTHSSSIALYLSFLPFCVYCTDIPEQLGGAPTVVPAEIKILLSDIRACDTGLPFLSHYQGLD